MEPVAFSCASDRYIWSKSKQPNKKEEKSKAAAKVYGYYGFEGATIERMADAAGVSRLLIIEHLDSKQQLAKEIASRAVAENLEKILRIDGLPGMNLRQRERERKLHYG